MALFLTSLPALLLSSLASSLTSLAGLAGPVAAAPAAARFASPPADTVRVSAQTLQLNYLQLGRHNYLIYLKRRPDGPSAAHILVNTTVARETYQGQPAIVVTQQWDKDTVIHAARTVLRAKDLTTRWHRTFWKRGKVTATSEFDFDQHTVRYAGSPVPDSVRQKAQRGFEQARTRYFLNWHTDLTLFPLLPYRAGTTFLIPFYDPGFESPSWEPYTVTGTETLTGANGQPRACWVLSYRGHGSTTRFWLDQKTHELLKEAEEFQGIFRYKVKLAVAAD